MSDENRTVGKSPLLAAGYGHKPGKEAFVPLPEGKRIPVEPELPNRFSDKTDLYADVANKLGVTREEAKARVLAEAYGLVKLSPLEQVAEFHAKFDLPGLEQQTPRELNDEEALFRIAFMLEELKEYVECSGFTHLSSLMSDLCEMIKGQDPYYTARTDYRDMHGELDALIDLSYVLHGTALFHGFKKFDRAFTHVHKKGNMVKVRATSAEQSKRGTKLDVVKPAGWTAPVLTEYLS